MKQPRCFSLAYSFVSFFAITFALAANISTANAQGFQPDCTLPFDAIKGASHPIDNKDHGCPIFGNKSGNDEQKQQNKAKNNFCATGTPVPITIQTFKDLQTKVSEKGIEFGRDEEDNEVLPPNRSVLRDLLTTAGGVKLGEGKVVIFVGFVLDARHSNVVRTDKKGKIERDSKGRPKGGESVNCSTPGCEFNDIHIDLSNKPTDAPCHIVSAEISPHFRPIVWDQFDSPEYLSFFHSHPVRLKGHLFFDASHKPCTGEVGDPPRRVSSWEIHPVYAIDVCKKNTLAACKINVESMWVPLDQSQLAKQKVSPGKNCKIPIK